MMYALASRSKVLHVGGFGGAFREIARSWTELRCLGGDFFNYK